MLKLVNKIIAAVEYRAEIGQYWIAATMAVAAIVAALAILVGLIVFVLAYLGITVYITLAVIGAIAWTRKTLMHTHPQPKDDDDDELGIG